MVRRRRGFRAAHLILAISFLVVAGVMAALWLGYQLWQREFPDVSQLKNQFPIVVYQQNNKPPRIKWATSRPAGWVSLGQISRVAVSAVVVSEDSAFYQHPGYDAAQIKEAVGESLESGHLGRGASTITQQVTRNVFLSQERSLWRKFKELILAIRLEEVVGKRRILETYFNIAEWGQGIYGIGPAARFYFHKSPSELTAREGAFLAMLLPSPKRYSQSFRAGALTHYASKTVRDILGKMVVGHHLTAEERDVEMNRRMSFETVQGTPEGDEETATEHEISTDSVTKPEEGEDSSLGLTPGESIPQTE